uniref:Uncharacterized protein n=1 Tax=Chromera velia CCMP2878 TaxID=1169474 RepID=A0A0G4FLD7_9ALVE|eukprot:Cvel_17459.t1-p1 / transcript=Cvel_17459.t1 / gene=Cvel_17459 / organism=Chromera_velia_CCMP2878 / gene_product=hypothetical protein / transcript_product=hypothetical protein / location=Cvel_scaffold1394:19992-28592(+) / protein_length=1292 / sequence_SO=supercontig / SO=protein_coding / is_pseudo=false
MKVALDKGALFLRTLDLPPEASKIFVYVTAPRALSAEYILLFCETLLPGKRETGGEGGRAESDKGDAEEGIGGEFTPVLRTLAFPLDHPCAKTIVVCQAVRVSAVPLQGKAGGEREREVESIRRGGGGLWRLSSAVRPLQLGQDEGMQLQRMALQLGDDPSTFSFPNSSGGRGRGDNGSVSVEGLRRELGIVYGYVRGLRQTLRMGAATQTQHEALGTLVAEEMEMDALGDRTSRGLLGEGGVSREASLHAALNRQRVHEELEDTSKDLRVAKNVIETLQGKVQSLESRCKRDEAQEASASALISARSRVRPLVSGTLSTAWSSRLQGGAGREGGGGDTERDRAGAPDSPPLFTKIRKQKDPPPLQSYKERRTENHKLLQVKQQQQQKEREQQYAGKGTGMDISSGSAYPTSHPPSVPHPRPFFPPYLSLAPRHDQGESPEQQPGGRGEMGDMISSPPVVNPAVPPTTDVTHPLISSARRLSSPPHPGHCASECYRPFGGACAGGGVGVAMRGSVGSVPSPPASPGDKLPPAPSPQRFSSLTVGAPASYRKIEVEGPPAAAMVSGSPEPVQRRGGLEEPAVGDSVALSRGRLACAVEGGKEGERKETEAEVEARNGEGKHVRPSNILLSSVSACAPSVLQPPALVSTQSSSWAPISTGGGLLTSRRPPPSRYERERAPAAPGSPRRASPNRAALCPHGGISPRRDILFASVRTPHDCLTTGTLWSERALSGKNKNSQGPLWANPGALTLTTEACLQLPPPAPPPPRPQRGDPPPASDEANGGVPAAPIPPTGNAGPESAEFHTHPPLSSARGLPSTQCNFPGAQDRGNISRAPAVGERGEVEETAEHRQWPSPREATPHTEMDSGGGVIRSAAVQGRREETKEEHRGAQTQPVGEGVGDITSTSFATAKFGRQQLSFPAENGNQKHTHGSGAVPVPSNERPGWGREGGDAGGRLEEITVDADSPVGPDAFAAVRAASEHQYQQSLGFAGGGEDSQRGLRASKAFTFARPSGQPNAVGSSLNSHGVVRTTAGQPVPSSPSPGRDQTTNWNATGVWGNGAGRPPTPSTTVTAPRMVPSQTLGGRVSGGPSAQSQYSTSWHPHPLSRHQQEERGGRVQGPVQLLGSSASLSASVAAALRVPPQQWQPQQAQPQPCPPPPFHPQVLRSSATSASLHSLSQTTRPPSQSARRFQPVAYAMPRPMQPQRLPAQVHYQPHSACLSSAPQAGYVYSSSTNVSPQPLSGTLSTRPPPSSTSPPYRWHFRLFRCGDRQRRPTFCRQWVCHDRFPYWTVKGAQ